MSNQQNLLQFEHTEGTDLGIDLGLDAPTPDSIEDLHEEE